MNSPAARKVIGPQGGRDSPQSQFLTTRADFAVFNGQPGCGKTSTLTLDMLRGVKLPLYRAAAFRRKAKQLTIAGSLWDLARRWYPHAGGTLVASPHLQATFRSGATIEYGHLNQEADKEGYDGSSFEMLAFDELPHFSEQQFWYLAGSRNRGVSGFKPCVRASTMAAPDSWVHKLVKPWLEPDGGWPDWSQSGKLRYFVRNPFDDQITWFESRAVAEAFADEVFDALLESTPLAQRCNVVRSNPKSFTVVHARTTDNHILLASSSEYQASLGLMTRYERERLAGNWNARPPSSGMFDRNFFKVLDAPPREDEIVFSVRGWDRASKIVSEVNVDPDWTRGVRLDLLRSGLLVISDVASLRDRPGQVDLLMIKTMELDGPRVTQACWINPGDSGVYEEENLRALFKTVRGCGPVIFRHQTVNKETYARPCAAFFDPELSNVARGGIVRAVWNNECLAEAEMFPLKKHPISGDDLHDDFVDAMSRAFIEFDQRRPNRGKLLDWADTRVVS